MYCTYPESPWDCFLQPFQFQVQSAGEAFFKKIPKVTIFDLAANLLQEEISKANLLYSQGCLLKSECLLLIAVTCKTAMGKNLARRELAALASRSTPVNESQVHPTLIKMANQLLQ